jgi:hypothetical protein
MTKSFGMENRHPEASGLPSGRRRFVDFGPAEETRDPKTLVFQGG